MSFNKDEEEIISDIYNMPVFYGLEHNEQIAIAKLLQHFSASSAEELLDQQKQQNRVYFIVEGQVEATFNYDKRITQVYEGQNVINSIALYNNNYTLAHLVSQGKTSGYYMNTEDFPAIQKQFPE